MMQNLITGAILFGPLLIFAAAWTVANISVNRDE